MGAQSTNFNVKLLTSIFLFLCFYTTNASYTERCMPTLDFPGYTRPKGDIYVRYGSPLEINCTLNDWKKYGNNLYFEIGSKRVDDDKITVVNESTIRYYDAKPEISSRLYVCKVDQSKADQKASLMVCTNKVIIGTKPSVVTDFKCISMNWDNMTCTWTRESGPTNVTYVLKNSFLKQRRSQQYDCPNLTYEGDKVSCFWSTSTTPIYRTSQEFFYFTLNATNHFGSTITNIEFNHYEHILPNKPLNLNCTKVEIRSAHLQWEISPVLSVLPRAFEHRIMYMCTLREAKDWKTITITTPSTTRRVNYTLQNMTHPNFQCDIRVAIKVNGTTSEELWSQNASIIIKTLGTKPEMPPKTTLGSFQVVNAGSDINIRQAFLYWQHIPEEYKNGPDFRYEVRVVGEPKRLPIENRFAYAKFEDLEKTKEYVFEITSKNMYGMSEDKSYITVSRTQDRPSPPKVDPKIDYRNGTFELSWNATGNIDDITNYTIFWCQNEKDRPHQCLGTLYWTVVPKLVTTYILNVKHDIAQFAVAANGLKGSSGMVWIQCTVIHNEIQGKINKVYINRVGSQSIELRWNIECSDGIGTVRAFIIYYCTTKRLKAECDEGMQKNMTIDGGADHAVIENLKPYTTYKMTIAVISKQGTFSEQSEPLYNTTLEDAPNEVQFMDNKVTEGKDFLHVWWKAPNTTNGIITKYIITLKPLRNPNNLQEINYTPPNNTMKEFNITFTNLTGFTNYTVGIRACTVYCSKPVVKSLRTEMGVPPKMKKPFVTYEREDSFLNWDVPTVLNGPLKHIEIEILSTENTSSIFPQIEKSQTKLNPFCPIEQGQKKNVQLDIKIRAVTSYNNTDYKGDWSDTLIHNCRETAQYYIWIWIAISLVLVFVAFYGVKRGYTHYAEMTNVQIKLPPGLTHPQMSDPPKHWDSSLNSEEASHKAPPADEEHLLEKLNECRVSSGDSSGCSSGHDSVASLESGNIVSNSSSDSGTEQLPSPDETNFLRRRKGESTLSASKGYVLAETVPSWKTNPPPPTNYCVFGVNPMGPQEEPENNSYIPIVPNIPAPAPSKGYVTCPTNVMSPTTTATGYCVLGVNPANVQKESESNYIPNNVANLL